MFSFSWVIKYEIKLHKEPNIRIKLEIYLWIRNDFRSKNWYRCFFRFLQNCTIFQYILLFQCRLKNRLLHVFVFTSYLRFTRRDRELNNLLHGTGKQWKHKTVWFCETYIFRIFTLHHSKRRLSNPHIDNQKTALSREKKFRVKQFERENSWLETFFRLFSRIFYQKCIDIGENSQEFR